jgi:hypothetical protein
MSASLFDSRRESDLPYWALPALDSVLARKARIADDAPDPSCRREALCRRRPSSGPPQMGSVAGQPPRSSTLPSFTARRIVDRRDGLDFLVIAPVRHDVARCRARGRLRHAQDPVWPLRFNGSLASTIYSSIPRRTLRFLPGRNRAMCEDRSASKRRSDTALGGARICCKAVIERV